MSARTSIQDRILKIRSVKRRMAERHLAQSEIELRNMNELAERIDLVRQGLGITSGVQHGVQLRANSEMISRLDNAKRSIAAPAAAAADNRDHKMELLVAARQRETGAEKLANSAAKQARLVAEMRENAMRIFRNIAAVEGEQP